ncbi:MAG: deoxyribose-phosphate aldolase [Eubacteriales bacterium]|nr:deoxyribose-phosphate aldolase [Eubacteriales bacterium]
MQLNAKEMAKFIDHTLLKPDATRAQIKKICDEAREYQFASVCVNSCWVGYVAKELAGSGVAPCCVVGFPLGAMLPEAKADEAALAVKMGAKEVDMVLNVGAAKGGEWDAVFADIQGVVAACTGRAKLKVIIETCLLTDDEKVKACELAKEAGADFVKTSTGFSTGGATEEDVALMRSTVGPDMGVKASGGIRTREDAVKMIAAGASRIGASAGIKIIQG